MSVLASPLVCTAACHSAAATDDTATDATLPPPEGDASLGDAVAVGPGADAGADADATLTAVDSAPEPDGGEGIADACGAVAIDGAFIEGTSDGCVSFEYMPCGLPATAQLQGCYIDLATCVGPCQSGYFLFCQLSPVSCNDAGDLLDGATIVECISCQGITGRRPLGLRPPRSMRRTPVGDYFAKMAHLESASVRAFRDLD